MFRKPKRPAHTVWIHCSASSNPKVDAKTVGEWHKARGWSEIGYHYFIKTDGTLEVGRDIEKVGAHVKDHNTGSIGICLNGLKPTDFTPAQFETLKALCVEIHEAYGGNIRFRGHKEVAAKACPVFDYKSVLKLDPKGSLGLTIEQTLEPVTPVSLKSLAHSKELMAGGAAVLSGAGGLVGGLHETSQTILVVALSIALLAGVAIIINRLWARKNRER